MEKQSDSLNQTPDIIDQFTIQLWRTYSSQFEHHAMSYGEEPDDIKAIWRREASSIYGLVFQPLLSKVHQSEAARIQELEAEYDEGIREIGRLNKNNTEVAVEIARADQNKKIGERWLYLLETLKKSFYEYEMDVDLEPPNKHIRMMQDLDTMINQLKSGTLPKEEK